MSLLIKGLNMPKNCLLCPCCVGEGIGMGRQHYCQVIDDEPCVSETYRPKNCPLVEIPTPHGRLIDENELLRHKYGFSQTDRVIIKTIDAVIEAENSSAIDDDVKKYCDYLKSETYDFCNRIENGEVNEE